jgi:hypothetical protein
VAKGVGSVADVRTGAREIKQVKDADPKASSKEVEGRGRRDAPISRVIRRASVAESAAS